MRLQGVAAALSGDPVLDGVDLVVAPGETVAVHGASGAGKSTLLGVIAGLIPVSSGEVWIEGTRIDRLSERARSAVRLARLGVVFQSDELLPELTLAENVTLPLRLKGRRRTTDGLLAESTSLLEELGILDYVDRLPAQVSGGQLQRAAIARALLPQPALVLADEPTAALDGATARKTVQLLIRLARERGSAVVLVTHDPDVTALCDRAVVLDAGRIAAGKAPGSRA